MRSMRFVLAAAALSLAGIAQADTITYNSAPSAGWHFGSDNDYSPSNSAVMLTDFGHELALRAHKTFEQAPASVGNVYSFALGTEPLSFDWGIDTPDTDIDALITLTNVGTGKSWSYQPLFVINDNSTLGDSRQNSFRLNWPADLFGSDFTFTPDIDSTYRISLWVLGLEGDGEARLDIFAMLGDGAAAPVPEPASWAMMIAGFGLIGGALRTRSMLGRSPA